MKSKKLLIGISRAKGRRRCLSGIPLDLMSGYALDVLNRDLILKFPFDVPFERGVSWDIATHMSKASG